MYEGYSTFGGIEVVNNQRCWQLALAAGGTWYLKRAYPEIEDALEADFSDPLEAPWYDPDLGDVSERFFGVYGLSMGGTFDSVRSQGLTQNSGEGATFGAPRRGSRSARVKAVILARGRDALEYGMAWLQTLMSTAGCGQSVDCDRADVLFFNDIPTDPDEMRANSRYLKQAAAISGPFVVKEMASRGIYALEIEWTWASERPFVFGLGRDVALTLAQDFALIQDSPINYIPFPNAKLEEDAGGYSRPVLARNLVLNPSLEAAATYTVTNTVLSGSAVSSYIIGGRVNTSVAAAGSYAYEAQIDGVITPASGVATIQIATEEIDITSIPASRYLEASIWAVALALRGASSAWGPITADLQFYNASSVAVGSAIPMTADARAHDCFTSAKTTVPATATKARIRVRADATWSAGASDTLASDMRLVVDLATIAYFGNS